MPDPLDVLRKKARTRDLEVEDLLGCARYPDAAMATGIEKLASDSRWEFGETYPNIPWREWAYLVAEYCRGGHPRLVEISRDQRLFQFVLGLLDEIGWNDALRTLLDAANHLLDHPERDAGAAHRVAAVLNTLCVRKRPIVQPASVDGEKVKSFLHRLFALAQSDSERGTVLYALRYFSDESSLPLVEGAPNLAPHRNGARAAARKAILKRRRQARP